MWIDAICINQEDTAEKGYQVGIMREIYLAAMRVVVWLGEEGDTARVAWKLCEELRDRPEGLGDSKNPDLGEEKVKKEQTKREEGLERTDKAGEQVAKETKTKQVLKTTNRSKLLMDEKYASGWEACEKLLSTPWFGRSWIIQEVLHANKAIAIIGDFQVSLDDLCSSLMTYVSYSTSKNMMRVRDLYVDKFHFLDGTPMNIIDKDGLLDDDLAIAAFERSSRGHARWYGVPLFCTECHMSRLITEPSGAAVCRSLVRALSAKTKTAEANHHLLLRTTVFNCEQHH